MESNVNYLDIFIKGVVPFAALFVGIFIERFKKAQITLEKKIDINRFALSIQNDPFFGDIQVSHKGNNVDNLYFVSVEILNTSKESLPVFEILYSFPIGYEILESKCILFHEDVSLEINYSESFRKLLTRAIEQDPVTDIRLDAKEHCKRHREFTVKILGRGKNLFANFLLSGPAGQDLKNHEVNVGIYENITITTAKDVEAHNKQKTNVTNIISFFVYVISVFLILHFNKDPRWTGAILIAFMFVSHFISLALYYLYTFFRDYFRK